MAHTRNLGGEGGYMKTHVEEPHFFETCDLRGRNFLRGGGGKNPLPPLKETLHTHSPHYLCTMNSASILDRLLKLPSTVTCQGLFH